MILIQYTNDKGYLCQAYVKNKSDNPSKGILYNPPCLDVLQVDENTKKELNNALIHSQLITYQDILKTQNGLTGVLNRMKLKQFRQQLINLYKIDRGG